LRASPSDWGGVGARIGASRCSYIFATSAATAVVFQHTYHGRAERILVTCDREHRPSSNAGYRCSMWAVGPHDVDGESGVVAGERAGERLMEGKLRR
jgi:hypothetical protein